MTVLSLQAILATVTQALPRLFLFGAPILAIVVAIAAFLDTRIPWSADHVAHARPLGGGPARR